MYNHLRIEIPGCNKYICPGNKVKLGRFESTVWIVCYGWIECNGNRPIYAWYLTNIDNPSETKLLSKPDLDDIYLIEI